MKAGTIMTTQSQKKTVNHQTFLKYTGLFLLLSAMIFSVFFVQGKTFIWEGDGFHQHYPFFREYLTILRNFFETGNWQSWDWTIGLGQDTLITYGYYVVGDPFVYLGLLFPPGSEELAFHVLMLVRIWAVGASFLLYAKKMSFSHYSALAGSIMYTFSHYVIYNVVRHPFFIHPMIFFPLLCLGIEKIFKKESGVFFSLMVAISAASNFYFFYMLTWMIFLYALIRYPSLVSKKGWKSFFSWFGYFIGLYLIGLLVSAMIFLPVVYGFLNASRAPGGTGISMIVYPLHYYGLLLLNSITPGTIYWTVGGFSVIGLLSLPFLAKRRKLKPGLFWGFVIIGIMLLFPFFGSLMNGMSGPYNRFTFVLPFYIALATAYFMEKQQDLTATDLTWMRRLLLAFSILYVLVSFTTGDYLLYLTPVLIGWLAYGFIQARLSNKLANKRFQQIIIGLIALNFVGNTLNFYLPHGKNAISETEDYGTIDEAYANVFEGVEENLPGNELYRTGVTSRNNHVRNQYAYLDLPGTTSYTSLTNGAVADFSNMIESSQYQVIQPLRNGIDDRRMANQALGVKYILTAEENAAYLPPDYEINPSLSSEEAGMMVAETENAAPFAYVETRGIQEENLKELHPVQRESLLAEAVILEDENTLQTVEEIPPLETHKGQWEQEPSNIQIEEENTHVTFIFEEPEDLIGQEVFLYFEGVDYQGPETSFGVPTPSSYRLNVAFNGQEKTALQSDEYTFSSYFKRENILFSLNEVTSLEESLTVEFEDIGHYRFDNVAVVSRPYDTEEASRVAEEKNERALEIEHFSNEEVVGSVVADEDGMLVTSIPYSSGWQAYVDGEENPTDKVNIGFIGVPLEAGEHEVEFVYQTPFLKAGTIVSGLGLAMLIGYAVVNRRFLP